MQVAGAGGGAAAQQDDGRPSREKGLAEKYSNFGQVTTLMLRNIPTSYTQDDLLEEIIECMGSSEDFDFLYLPWDSSNACNVGYAFVNFREVSEAERCTRILDNAAFRKSESRRCCKVVPAHVQGLENNIRHLAKRAVTEAHTHYPIIMWRGKKLKMGQVIDYLDALAPGMVPPRSAPGRVMGFRNHGPPPLTPLVPPLLPHLPASSHINFFADDQDVFETSGPPGLPPGLTPPHSMAGYPTHSFPMPFFECDPNFRSLVRRPSGLLSPAGGAAACFRPGIPVVAEGPAVADDVPAPPSPLSVPPLPLVAARPAEDIPQSSAAADVRRPAEDLSRTVVTVRGGLTEIRLKDPEQDVFAKFLKKFS